MGTHHIIRRAGVCAGSLFFIVCTAVAGVPEAARITAPPRERGTAPIAEAGDGGAAVAPAEAAPAYMVELVDEPVATVYARVKAEAKGGGDAETSAAAAGKAQFTKIESAQKALLPALEAKDSAVQVMYRVQRAYNGIAVLAPADAVEDLRRLPGVKAVHRLRAARLDNSTSVPFIGAPDVWGSADATGAGVRLGIIDSGIDYVHADFGGGTFPSAKVVGGYDFAGPDYNASDPNNLLPNPDDDPMDCDGHGTHVAATAAGFGVGSDGSTYNGPYDTSTNFDALKVGPGVAPEALLYALKVFGCSDGTAGSTYLVPEAIDWTTDPNQDGDLSDHLDVVNISIGSPYRIADEDVDSKAVENAVAAGVIIVGSSGNNGDTYYATGGPGAAPAAISVAASVDDGITYSGLQVNAPASVSGIYEAGLAQFGPVLTDPGVSGELVDANPIDGCGAIVSAVMGRVALINRGNCYFQDKVLNAEAAGAIAVVVVNNVSGPPIEMSGVGGAEPSIPSVMISMEDGQLLRNVMAAETVTVTLASTVVLPRPDLLDTMASFSSRGPTIASFGGMLKPDVSAPGLSITSAAFDTGAESTNLGGTSMASPHVAGMAALLQGLHPDWTPGEIKAAIMNSAVHNLFSAENFTPPIYGAGRMGAGRVDAGVSALQPVVAFDAAAPERVSVTFDTESVVQTAREDRVVRFHNLGATAKGYTLSLHTLVDTPGVEFSLPGAAAITVPAGGSTDVTVRLDAAAMDMEYTHDATVEEMQNGEPRHWLTEETAYIEAVDTDAQAQGILRVPLYAALRPAATVHGALQKQAEAAGQKQYTDAQALLSGVDITTGDLYDFFSSVAALELQYEGPDDPGIGGGEDMRDIRYVGVTTDLPATDLASASVYFGVSTAGNWGSPNMVSVLVDIDTDEDGVRDTYLINSYSGSLSSADINDVYTVEAWASDGGTGVDVALLNEWAPTTLNTVPLNNSVMVLPAPVAFIGLEGSDTRFNYRVTVSVSAMDEPQFRDVTPWLTYDIAAPGIDASSGAPGLPTYHAEDGSALPFSYSAARLNANNSLGLMLVHFLNAPGERVDAIALPGTTTALPIVRGVSPGSGPSTGGATVTLTGENFEGISQVLFDNLPAKSFTVVSDTEITAVTPAADGRGPVTVAVASPEAKLLGGYSYVQSAADLDGDDDIDAVDVQTVINGALGLDTENDTDVDGDGDTDAVDVQLVINGALGLAVL